jgi:hypothetical protein
MNLDELKKNWKQEASAQASEKQLTKEEIMQLLHDKTTDIRRKIRRRLHTEISYYVIILAIVLPHATQGLNLAKGLYLGFMVLLVGVVIATLSYKSRQLRSVHLTGSLHQSLTYMIWRLESTMKTYMAAYMAFIVSMIALLEAFMVSRHSGEHATIALWLTGGLITIVLSYWCGRGYVQRILGRYKGQLISCLNELQAT